MAAVRFARCHCGSLSLKCSGEPTKVSMCHCEDCQRRTGSAFSIAAFFERGSVERVSGGATTFTRGSASGHPVAFHFCPNCGTSILWESDRAPETCGIAAGCFADLDFPAPGSSVYEEAMHSWLALPSVAEHYDQALSPPPPAS